jgi:hypothetical protein
MESLNMESLNMESLNDKFISRIRKHRRLIKTKTTEWANALNEEYVTKEEGAVLILKRDSQLDYYWTEYYKFLATHNLELNDRSYSEDLYELLNETDDEVVVNCPVNGYSRRIRERISKYEFDENFMKFYLYNEQNKQILCVSMDPDTRCCEQFGIKFPADMTPFINKTILSIKTVYTDNMSCYKINITTHGGSFDIIVYNEHNGYYPHRIHIEYADVIIDKYI